MLDGLKASLKHPLSVVVVSAVLGSVLIPPISDSINSKKVLREARLRKAVEIVDNNTKTITQLNSMVTRLSTFHDNNIRGKPTATKLKELQDKLVEDMDSRWLEFEKTGWWWYQDLNDEAVILGIIPTAGSGALRQHINAYHDNILATSNAMKLLWRLCKSEAYDYKDDSINQTRDEMNKKLTNLFNERIQLVNNLVNDFTGPTK